MTFAEKYKTMKQLIIIALCLCAFAFSGQTQNPWGFGFKVGLNTSGVFGESEQDADGNALETFQTIGGFQVGGLVQFKINKLLAIRNEFGLQTELLFSQKGADYKYEGPSYQAFTSPIGANLPSTGQRLILINATNSYISIPLMAYAHIKNFNFGLGGYMDILVGSSATGETVYSGDLDNGTGIVEEHLVNYTFNYLRDEAGEQVGTTNLSVLVGSDNVSIPNTEGAYYHWSTKDGNYYNNLDFGLVGNLGWRFNNGLRFDFRVNYGLTDVTNNFYDFSRQAPDANGNLVPRMDDDRSISYQVTLGFGF
jgi:hypothetical protein